MCYQCGQKGHYAKSCPQKRLSPAPRQAGPQGRPAQPRETEALPSSFSTNTASSPSPVTTVVAPAPVLLLFPEPGEHLPIPLYLAHLMPRHVAHFCGQTPHAGGRRRAVPPCTATSPDQAPIPRPECPGGLRMSLSCSTAKLRPKRSFVAPVSLAPAERRRGALLRRPSAAAQHPKPPWPPDPRPTV